MPYRRKLIEVALPLEAINAESAREKSIRHGHPSTLHLWWARRPLAACRAVLFAQLVDDPSEYMPDEESANAERERLFKIIEDLVKWENINNEEVLDKAKLEIARSVARDLGVDVPVGKQAIREFLATKAPPVLDPFAGGGSIPLEAQRLGLRAYASDLNPVAVLINKALIEIPPKFAGLPPVHPSENEQQQLTYLQKEWKGAEGLADDVRYYGKWMRDEAFKRIGHLYPPVKITEEILAERPDLKAQGIKPGDELTVIAWLWARTVKCPNPACGSQMPLISTFSICNKQGKSIWVEPVIKDRKVSFVLRHGDKKIPDPPKVGRGVQFKCLVCGQLAQEEYIKNVGIADHSSAILMGIVAEGKNGRSYFAPDAYHEQAAHHIQLNWRPNLDLSTHPQYMAPPRYKMVTFADLHTARQLSALVTLSDLVQEAAKKVLEDATEFGLSDNHLSLVDGGAGAKAYAEAIGIYLGMNVSRQANRLSALCFWHTIGEKIEPFFTRQAYTMNWNFAEANPFSDSSGNFMGQLDYLTWVIEALPGLPIPGKVDQKDAVNSEFPTGILVSTDPPYYDNVPYADLSDFFYIWLRRSLLAVYPSLFQTMLVPKKDELVADHQRHGGREEANKFFENGLNQVFSKFHKTTKTDYPLTVYYAFKQTESDEPNDAEDQQELASTGWETMLEGLLSAGFSVHSTWPMRTEQATNIKKYRNALASSIVLVCRSRPDDAPVFTRRDFWSTLKRELPLALRQLQQGSIAPVDLAQAAIGPGMAVFSRYKQVLEADGSPMSVRTALALINQALDEFLAEQEGEYDSDTRWALAWYEQYGHEQGLYGVAETLSKAKNTSVEGLVEASILEARAGKVRLLRRDELDPNWDPQKDKRPTAWEACQHLIFDLDKTGEQAAAVLLAKLGSLSETARDLAYRLYTICERKGWAQDALGYNMLVVAWPRLKELARGKQDTTQKSLF